MRDSISNKNQKIYHLKVDCNSCSVNSKHQYYMIKSILLSRIRSIHHCIIMITLQMGILTLRLALLTLSMIKHSQESFKTCINIVIFMLKRRIFSQRDISNIEGVCFKLKINNSINLLRKFSI
jgi:hypothetical protein